MSLKDLLTASSRPLFIVGSGKDAGKTVALNRLRAEARREGVTGFGLCSAGWDGETHDHLTGADKPRVRVYAGDVVMTAASLLHSAEARFELFWAAGLSGRMGRMAIGRCRRPGEVEIVGPPSVADLADGIERISRLGVRRVLVDGAVDRKTPISAIADADVGLAFAPEPRETAEKFSERISQTLELYLLPKEDSAPPKGLRGEQVALGTEGAWSLMEAEDLERCAAASSASAEAWAGGPLTPSLLETLLRCGVTRLTVRDPSRIFIPTPRLRRLFRTGFSLRLHARPSVQFVSVRCDGGPWRSLPPRSTLEMIRARWPQIPCFDSWAA